LTKNSKQELTFRFFNEISIIQQLSSNIFGRHLPDGLHVSHFSVLNHLIRMGDGRTPLQITESFQVTKGTMTHTLSTLSGRGLINIQPHATDGRSKVVFLTSAGREFHAVAINTLGEAFKKLGTLMNVDELIAILPVVQQLREALDANRDL
jgi:DNA-binding MarR family transcriptional regulator